MKTINQMIEDLIDDDIQVAMEDGYNHLYQLFLNGVTGYKDMSDDEIKKLHNEFEEQKALANE